MKKYIAECLGTFVLTFLGCGAAVSLGCGTPEGGIAAVVGTAIAFGLSVVAMAYTRTASATCADRSSVPSSQVLLCSISILVQDLVPTASALVATDAGAWLLLLRLS